MKIRFELKSNTLNKKGRIYTEEAIENAFNEYNKKSIKLGKFGLAQEKVLDLTNAAFQIKGDVKKVNENWWECEIETLQTDSGLRLNKELMKLLDDGTLISTCVWSMPVSQSVEKAEILSIGISPKKDIEYK